MKTVNINGNVYQMGDITAKAVLKTAKDAMKGKNAIYALEKDGLIEMRKDIFKSMTELKSECAKYINLGMKVWYVMNGKNAKRNSKKQN